MTRKPRPRSFDRILVALDRSRSSRSALEAAAMLAEALQSELHGLFVEDADLLALAQLPFSREIQAQGGGIRNLDPGDLERAFEIEMAEARSAVETAAAQRGLRWKFQSVRGKVHTEVNAAATEVDILCIGRHGASTRQAAPLGGTVRMALAGRAPVLIASDPSRCLGGPVAVLFDASAAALDCARLGAEIAQRSGQDLILLVRASSDEEEQLLQKALDGHLPDGVRSSYVRVDPADPSTPPQTVRARQFGLIVSTTESGIPAPAWLEFMALAAGCPLLLVPNGQKRDTPG